MAHASSHMAIHIKQRSIHIYTFSVPWPRLSLSQFVRYDVAVRLRRIFCARMMHGTARIMMHGTARVSMRHTTCSLLARCLFHVSGRVASACFLLHVSWHSTRRHATYKMFRVDSVVCVSETCFPGGDVQVVMSTIGWRMAQVVLRSFLAWRVVCSLHRDGLLQVP